MTGTGVQWAGNGFDLEPQLHRVVRGVSLGTGPFGGVNVAVWGGATLPTGISNIPLASPATMVMPIPPGNRDNVQTVRFRVWGHVNVTSRNFNQGINPQLFPFPPVFLFTCDYKIDPPYGPGLWQGVDTPAGFAPYNSPDPATGPPAAVTCGLPLYWESNAIVVPAGATSPLVVSFRAAYNLYPGLPGVGLPQQGLFTSTFPPLNGELRLFH